MNHFGFVTSNRCCPLPFETHGPIAADTIEFGRTGNFIEYYFNLFPLFSNP